MIANCMCSVSVELGFLSFFMYKNIYMYRSKTKFDSLQALGQLGRKEMFYLTQFIYGYMVSNIW